MADAMAMDGGLGSDRASAGKADDGFGLTEQSVLAALQATASPIAPADLIRELECAGFRNPEIRSAIWHLLDRHRVRLTRDLRLVLPVPAPTAPNAPS